MKIRRSAPGILTAVLVLLFLSGPAAPAEGADAGSVKVVLELDKDYYGAGEPIRVRVTIRNTTAETLAVSKGFGTKNPALELRLIDPAKNLLKLLPRPGLRTETPDTPPLPHVMAGGKLVEAAPCEGLQASAVKLSPWTNLREYFELALPGTYSAQVQKSAMVFKGKPGEVCDISDPAWVGVFKSNTAYFFFEGITPVEIVPAEWPSAWQFDTGNVVGTLDVRIYPRTGAGLGDYDTASIRLNNIKPTGPVQNLGTHLLARFGRKAALGSLGQPLQDGRQYPAVVSGRLKNGTLFGGARKVTVRASSPPPFIK